MAESGRRGDPGQWPSSRKSTVMARFSRVCVVAFPMYSLPGSQVVRAHEGQWGEVLELARVGGQEPGLTT